MALLILLPGLPLKAQSPGRLPQAFDLTIRLHDGRQVASTRVLRKGTILQPIDPAGNWHPLQPVVLCQDTPVHFAEDGVSDPVRIVGFCYGPGLPAANEKIAWWTTPWTDRTIAHASSCGPEMKIEIRERRANSTFSGEVIDACSESLPTCRERFNSDTRKLFHGKELSFFERHNACGVQLERNWTLRCDLARARAIQDMPETGASNP